MTAGPYAEHASALKATRGMLIQRITSFDGESMVTVHGNLIDGDGRGRTERVRTWLQGTEWVCAWRGREADLPVLVMACMSLFGHVDGGRQVYVNTFLVAEGTPPGS